MPMYAVNLDRAASTGLSVGTITASTSPRRGLVPRFVIGSPNSPSDTVYGWEVQRCTTQGTATSYTPVALNPASPAALCNAHENHTVDPTLTANAVVFSVPLHQRATYQFFAPPGCELIFPGTSGNGLAWRTPVAGSNPTILVSAHYEE